MNEVLPIGYKERKCVVQEPQLLLKMIPRDLVYEVS